MAEVEVSLKINGKLVKRKVPPTQTLAQFLNEELNMTGTKTCCEQGICKACTVALAADDKAPLAAVQSCVIPVSALNGQSVTTVEGLGSDNKLSSLQEAFLKNFSFQCGYSTPGFLLGATVLMDQLKRQPVARADVDAAIKNAVGQHVCRCTGYVRYYQAIKEVILSTPGLTLS